MTITIEQERQLIENFYKIKGITDSTVPEKIAYLKNRTGYEHFHVYGQDNMVPKEIEAAKLGALEFALLELL
jgi:type II restriction/modification system DNA methylase subunit YeeA